jgi:hypothetical protein
LPYSQRRQRAIRNSGFTVLRPIALSTINERMIFSPSRFTLGESCANCGRVLWAGRLICQATIEPAGF